MILTGATLPVVSAQWQTFHLDQNPEPSTKWDVASRMWPDAPTAAVDHIYFDVHINDYSFVGPTVGVPNPQGVLVRPYGLAYFTAVLGYWRDCNDDGFMGEAVTGADPYPVELLADDSICPAETAYNDGLFVYEYLAIGTEADDEFDDEVNGVTCDTAGVLCQRGGWNYIRDDAADVWHDFGLPIDPPANTRLLLPFPQGTLSDTNGHFRYIDSSTFGRLSGDNPQGQCNIGPQAGMNLCWIWPSKQREIDDDGPGGVRARATPNQCDENDPVNNVVSGLSNFPDAPDAGDCPSGGTSPIPNAPNPVTAAVRDRYNDSTGGPGPSGTPIVQPWSWGPRGDRDAANDECELRTSPTDWELNPDGAVYPTADHIYRSTVSAAVADPCSNENAQKAPAVGYFNYEAPASPGVVAGKLAANSGFGFGLEAHFNPSETLGQGDVEVCVPGQEEARPQRCGGMWFGGSQWILTDGVTALNPNPFGNLLATFYADVSFSDVFGGPDNPRFNIVDRDGVALVAHSAATALPGHGDNVHTYGEENCAVGRGTTATGAWVCNAAAWIAQAQLDPAEPADAEAIYQLPKPGKGYDLRDVDCYDNGIMGTSINEQVRTASGALLGAIACANLAAPVFV